MVRRTGRVLPPWYLGPVNKVIVGLHRLGVPMPMPALTVPGRKTGVPRSTPVSPYEVDGRTYVVAGYAESDWAKNARAAGRGELTRGRRRERVRLVPLPVPERARILREFPVRVPHGVTMFLEAGTVANSSPEAFAAAADRCEVFRIEPLD
ncbi:nitroreductase family deazaflavin-dependent oxidoreductase [Rhodococcus opacus]|uniref:nitroreductase family deazaflavin-dependent oxidoreductase n=1 Tax=Rhodococcus opacus TaxID=37919 RepID=UPI001C47C512|nr:nitroreductase family deazaflavin-dependent oxidoreductase [Rhodococcus opacus]MBV6756790.1 nitroreductase family deazaflavin-dependent oxidoreductase [Rhodococcus opacus]